jgi:TetR/AcrR family fatty acid metabolism transcriptional regulator
MIDPIHQQLITARKNQILDAAAVVFAERGFHPTTIRDIAKHAGIADGTIYNYFASKPALLLGIFERMKVAIIQRESPLLDASTDFRTFLRTFLYHPLMALKADHFALFRIIISEMMVNEELRTLYYQQILEPTLATAEAFFSEQLTKRGRSATDAKLIIRAISGMIMGLTLEYIMGDTILTADWDKLPDLLTDLILNGLNNQGEA